jgi:hypothetical protein
VNGAVEGDQITTITAPRVIEDKQENVENRVDNKVQANSEWKQNSESEFRSNFDEKDLATRTKSTAATKTQSRRKSFTKKIKNKNKTKKKRRRQKHDKQAEETQQQQQQSLWDEKHFHDTKNENLTWLLKGSEFGETGSNYVITSKVTTISSPEAKANNCKQFNELFF